MTQSTSANTVDVGALLDTGRWSLASKGLVLLAAFAIILDGFDNQVLGFALPAIIKEWGGDRSQFAPVVAVGLIGMAIGAICGGLAGDRFGRKVALVGSVVLFAVATAAIALAGDVTTLALIRFVAGAGVGAALPNASALAAEFTPVRNRPFAVTFTIVCVPLGGMVGGLVAAALLPTAGWRALFLVGGAAPLVLAAILLFVLPESPRFLARFPHRKAQLAAVLARLGHPVSPDATFIDITERTETKPGVGALFASLYRRDTLALWGAFFFCLFAVYSVFSWAPTLLSSAGLGMAAASNAVAVYNFGGVLGALFCAWLIGKAGSRRSMIALAILGAATAAVLRFVPVVGSEPLVLMFWLGLHGLAVNGVQTTLYAVAAHVYATDVRSTGSGMALGIGRLGAILSSFTGAAVIGQGPHVYYLLLAGAMIGCAVCLALVKRHIPKLTPLAAEGR